VNPYYKKCPDCVNGSTTALARLNDLVGLIMLSGSDSVAGKNHPYFNDNWAFYHKVIPSKDILELTTGLAGRPPSFPMGHDGCDRWSATNKIIKAAGLPKKWGYCKTCKGTGIDPTVVKKYNRWRTKEPPKGVGYQLWETTSEGSPDSPVFKTLDELAEWCEKNATTFADNKASKEQWMKMLGETVTETGKKVQGLVCHQEGNFTFM
jgi:hypothetical protein